MTYWKCSSYKKFWSDNFVSLSEVPENKYKKEGGKKVYLKCKTNFYCKIIDFKNIIFEEIRKQSRMKNY